MGLDGSGGDVVMGAGIVAGAALVVYVAGRHRDSVLGLPPVAARLLALVVGYLAALVLVGGLVHARMEDHGAGSPLLIAVGAAAFWAAGTGRRVGRHAGRLMGWRTTVTGVLEPEEIVPVDEIGDDVDLAAASAAARSGDWRPAAALLRATRDADVRMDRIDVLVARSLDDPRWVHDWFTVSPEDPLVAAVRAVLAMQQAWAARGHAQAEYTSTEQFESFAAGLERAEQLAERAAELAPDDPTPWATLVEIARGQGVTQEEFERRVDELFARAPHHVDGSFAVLQALCAKWRGSDEIMFECARGLASGAPAGSATCLLPVMAHVERHTQLQDGAGGPAAAARHMESAATRAEMHDAVACWLAGPDGGPRPGGRLFGHNLAAYAFWLADDRDAARPHLEAIGRSVTRVPWSYYHEPGEALGVVRKWAGLPVVAAGTTERGQDLEPFAPA